MFRTASNWLEGKRHGRFTTPVVYMRAEQSVPVDATIGRTEYEQDDGYGIIVRAESRDFLIRAADLVIDGVTTLPEVGDRIEESQCGASLIYEVLPIGGNQTHWRYSDPYRRTLRIHTKLILSDALSCPP